MQWSLVECSVVQRPADLNRRCLLKPNADAEVRYTGKACLSAVVSAPVFNLNYTKLNVVSASVFKLNYTELDSTRIE